MLSKVFIDDLKALKTLEFSDLLFCPHEEMFLSIDFISGLVW